MRAAFFLTLLLFSGACAVAQSLRDSVVRVLERHTWRSQITERPTDYSAATDTSIVELRGIRFYDSANYEGRSYTYGGAGFPIASGVARIRGTLHIDDAAQKAWVTLAEDSLQTRDGSFADLYPQQGTLTLTRDRKTKTFRLDGKLESDYPGSVLWMRFQAVRPRSTRKSPPSQQ